LSTPGWSGENIFDPAQPIGWVQMALATSGAHLTLRVNSGRCAQQGSVTNLAWR